MGGEEHFQCTEPNLKMLCVRVLECVHVRAYGACAYVCLNRLKFQVVILTCHRQFKSVSSRYTRQATFEG